MNGQNLLKLPNNKQEKEEMIQKIQTEITMLQNSELNEVQIEHLLYLIKQLKELKNMPKFDVEQGWREFQKDYLPEIEQFKKEEQKRNERKVKYRKFILKKVVIVSFVIVFTAGLTGIVTGRTGFVNYFSRNAQGTEMISSRSSEDIQKDLEKEYVTLEKQYGIKIGKLNLSSQEYSLQDYILSEKYISIIYLNLNTKENIVFCFFKNTPNSGKITLENTTIENIPILETYSYKEDVYDIMKNKERYYVSWQRDGIYYILQNCSSLQECKTIIQNILY